MKREFSPRPVNESTAPVSPGKSSCSSVPITLNTFICVFLLLLLTVTACNNRSAVDIVRQGSDLSDKGEYDKAAAKFKEALKLDPDYLEAYLAWGRVKEQQKDVQGAVETYETVLEKHPKHVTAHMYLANAYRKLGDFKKAEELLLEARKLSPSDIGIAQILGRLYLALKDYEQARATLEAASAIDRNDHEVHMDLAAAYEGLNDQAMAIKHYQAAYNLVHDIPTPKRQKEAAALKAKIRALGG